MVSPNTHPRHMCLAYISPGRLPRPIDVYTTQPAVCPALCCYPQPLLLSLTLLLLLLLQQELWYSAMCAGPAEGDHLPENHHQHHHQQLPGGMPR
jgi:hypothetical protein